MRKWDKDRTGRKAKEDHEMAGGQGWVPSRAGPGGAAEGMGGGLHLLLRLLGFFHSLHLHLLFFDSLLFLGDEVVHVHTTLETQSEVGSGSSGERSGTQTPTHTPSRGTLASPSVSASHSRAQHWQSKWWLRSERSSHQGPPWPGDEWSWGG